MQHTCKEFNKAFLSDSEKIDNYITESMLENKVLGYMYFDLQFGWGEGQV